MKSYFGQVSSGPICEGAKCPRYLPHGMSTFNRRCHTNVFHDCHRRELSLGNTKNICDYSEKEAGPDERSERRGGNDWSPVEV